MKVLYIYSHDVVCAEGHYYHSYLAGILKRYHYFSDSITVCTSIDSVNSENKKIIEPKNRISEKYRFVKIDKINTLTKKITRSLKNKKIISSLIATHDLIIVKIPSEVGGVAVKIANKINKPILVEMVGCVWDSLVNHSIRGRLYAPYASLKTKITVKNAPYVIYVTNQFLQSRYPTKGKFIGCSDVVIRKNQEDVLNNRLRRYSDINMRTITLCTLAGLDVSYKRQQDVIRVIYRLNKRGYKINYYLAGGGSGNRLRELACKLNISNQIHILGSLSHKDVFHLLNKIDLYIQPSKQEGLPRAVIEAMSLGCPVIGTYTGGVPELVNEPFIYKAGSVTSLEKIIMKLDSEQLKDMSKKNYTESQKYAAEVLDKKRHVFYDLILKEME